MKPLIVFYSYTGHTQRIAQGLEALTGGDLCPIFPSQPYPMAFPELLAQVRKEVDAHYRPPLLNLGPLPRAYRTVFVGCPNWCGTIAPPLASWLYGHDLAGKQVLPFFSHCGGVRGDLRGAVGRLCPKARVGEALEILEEEQDLEPLLRRWLLRCGAALPVSIHF